MIQKARGLASHCSLAFGCDGHHFGHDGSSLASPGAAAGIHDQYVNQQIFGNCFDSEGAAVARDMPSWQGPAVLSLASAAPGLLLDLACEWA